MLIVCKEWRGAAASHPWWEESVLAMAGMASNPRVVRVRLAAAVVLSQGACLG